MKHATLAAALCLGLTTVGLSDAAAQSVQLAIKDGRVTLKAEQATVRQILAEWERQGQVKVVGAERLTAAATQPLTLTLNDMPERRALEIVLRSVPGYLAVDRAADAAGASRYDRLVLLPRVTAVASATPANTAPPPVQAYTPPVDTRADADQAVDADGEVPEPPMPGAPVVNPYPGGAPAANGPGGNAFGAGATVGVQPPETQFDYANPRAYFDRMRQQQLQQGQTGQPGSTTMPALFPGSYTSGPPPATGSAPSGPTATPTAPGTLARPGIAPTPQTQQQPPGQFFNPYNLPPGYVPPQGTAPPATNVEPDRSKYANPYVPPSKPPNN
jgi:hypothetical protein